MELTPTEELLIEGLTAFEVSKENTIGVLLFLQTEIQQNLLIDYMRNHQEATEQDILQEMKRILRMK